jgi:hypothetical protein
MALGKKDEQKKVFSLELDQIGARGLPTAKIRTTGKNKSKIGRASCRERV